MHEYEVVWSRESISEIRALTSVITNHQKTLDDEGVWEASFNIQDDLKRRRYVSERDGGLHYTAVKLFSLDKTRLK